MPWPFSRRHADPLVQAYVDATARRPHARMSLDEVNFVVLDSETTGFNTSTDRMLSLATVPVRGREISIKCARSWMIRQAVAPVTDAVAVHGILPCETAEGIEEAEVMRDLLPHLTGTVVVGHHVRFDAGMINNALQRHLRTSLRNPLIDTAHLAMATLEAFRKSGYINQRPPTLEEICAHCGIEMMERHTAVGDAFTTAEVFLLLTALLRRVVTTRSLRLGDLVPARA